MFIKMNEYIDYLVNELGWPKKVAEQFAAYAWQFNKNKEETKKQS